MVPFALPDITEHEITAVTECLRSGWLTTGKVTQAFEERFAEAVGAKHAIAVNSATMGALLLLDALGIGPGDEVIFPTMTFSGPAMMARKLGAWVVLADCLPGSNQVDPLDVARKITKRTKAVVVTHFGGAPCHAAQLVELCDEHGIPVIDDAAHAFPSRYVTGEMVGGAKTLATFFSFYATKCLTTGEGGMITTQSDELARKVRQLRLHGFDRPMFDRYTNPGTGWRYDIAFPGWKANLTDMASAMGLVQLDRAEEMLWKRSLIAARYLEAFEGKVDLPPHDDGHAWHLFPIRVHQRDKFIAAMAERGVQCSVHFIPLHLHSYWHDATFIDPGELPNAESMHRTSVSLPIFSSMTTAQVDAVIDAVLYCLGNC